MWWSHLAWGKCLFHHFFLKFDFTQLSRNSQVGSDVPFVLKMFVLNASLLFWLQKRAPDYLCSTLKNSTGEFFFQSVEFNFNRCRSKQTLEGGNSIQEIHSRIKHLFWFSGYRLYVFLSNWMINYWRRPVPLREQDSLGKIWFFRP